MSNIHDVARRAGVSSATVSRVLNQTVHVRPETAARVRQAMRDLNFEPNVFAQSLQSNSMRVLAVLTVDISDEYFSVAVQEIERHARTYGYDVQVSFAKDDPKDQRQRIKKMLHKRIDGLILAGSSFTRANNAVAEEIKGRIPVAVLNGDLSGDSIYSVLSDDYEGLAEVVDHLVSSGRKRLAYVQDASNPAAQEKLRGFVDASNRCGADFLIVNAERGAQGAEEALREASSELYGVDAIVCAEDVLAIGALKYVKRAGFRVPEDIAITGYDDLAIARYPSPELTSVNGRVADLSKMVVELLVSHLRNESPPPRVTFKPFLTVRKSSVLTR